MIRITRKAGPVHQLFAKARRFEARCRCPPRGGLGPNVTAYRFDSWPFKIVVYFVAAEAKKLADELVICRPTCKELIKSLVLT